MSTVLDAEFCELPCRVLMMKAPPTADAEERLVDVTSRLLGVDFKAVIVYDDDEPAGLITLKDIMKWLVEAEDKNTIQVKELISVPLITVDIETPLLKALDLMRKFEIRYLAAIENKVVKGLITEKGIKEFCELYPHYLRTYLD
ncbi:MAG: CBS domain-containing protein [Candidatus Bathyarchaeota archaeon]|nr:CBS domain-containing protein [Candidatus Bathyarchaeota archaeon]